MEPGATGARRVTGLSERESTRPRQHRGPLRFAQGTSQPPEVGALLPVAGPVYSGTFQLSAGDYFTTTSRGREEKRSHPVSVTRIVSLNPTP